MKFDDEVVRTHDELLEQMNRATQSNASASELFGEIDRWETVTIEKVHKAAERTRHQLTQLLTQEKASLTNDFGIMTKEIRGRRDEDDFDENDIERLQQKINQIQISLKQFTGATKTKVIIVTNDQVDWNRFIYVEKEENRSNTDIHVLSTDMASGLEPTQCSICQKSAGKCICNGCKNYFCIKHFNQHRQQLSMKFDDEVVRTHDELLEQMNRATQSNASASELFREIDRWETVTIEKVHKAAERARHQLTQLLTQEKASLTNDFGTMTKEIRGRRDEDAFDENDIERLQQKINQIQISLKQFTRATKTKAILVINDQVDWNRFIYVEKEENRSSE
ncbi:unnamed protein product [Rotaria sordida]|uniref:Uncharacterized protein n=1 Tax=Rotaria sordida TaxID=392033 RepID=A0A815D4P6_9BILA|nr:unnamed protein product [Rotaria sordida]